MRILLAEDDPSLSCSVAEHLRAGGFAVDACPDGIEALHLAVTEPYAALVLDLGLPGLDGVAILKAVRAASRDVPVLVLTARSRLGDKAQAFRAGADDYLTKPFAPEELTLRLHALIRRAGGRAQVQIEVGDLLLDTSLNAISRAGLPLDLTHLEGKVLGHLMRRAGAVVSRTEISEAIYELETDVGFNTIEVVVSRLRKKIGRDRIETIRGGGYRLRAGGGSDALA